VWRRHPVEGYCDTCWLTGLWSIPAKVEGVLKAAWHWGSNRRVINGSLGISGHTPLYVGLLSVWDSVDGNRMFPPYSMGELLKWRI